MASAQEKDLPSEAGALQESLPTPPQVPSNVTFSCFSLSLDLSHQLLNVSPSSILKHTKHRKNPALTKNPLSLESKFPPAIA